MTPPGKQVFEIHACNVSWQNVVGACVTRFAQNLLSIAGLHRDSIMAEKQKLAKLLTDVVKVNTEVANHLTGMSGELDEAVCPSVRRPRGAPVKYLTCFNCGRAGHYRSNCKERHMCHRCG